MEEFDNFLKEHDNFTSYVDKRKSKSSEKDIENRYKQTKTENLFDDLFGDINGEDK